MGVSPSRAGRRSTIAHAGRLPCGHDRAGGRDRWDGSWPPQTDGSRGVVNDPDLALIVLAVLVGACTPPPPEMQVINDAAAALGGADRIQSVTTLIIEGKGSAPNVGQNRMPDDELPVWKVNGFTRTIDLANGRTRVQQLREAQFLFAGAPAARDAGPRRRRRLQRRARRHETRAGEAAARDRRIEMLHHPITIVRAALDPAAKVTQPSHGRRTDSWSTSRRRRATPSRWPSTPTQLPTRVISMADNANMGDVAIVTSFSDYEDVNGLQAAEAADDEDGQVPAVRSAGVEERPRRRRRRSGGPAGGQVSDQCRAARRSSSPPSRWQGHLVARRLRQPSQRRLRVRRSPRAVRGAAERGADRRR